MTRVAAGFVGCKVSQADGELALAELAAAGLEPVTVREAADVVVVHTCCVTAEAERKSRRLVRRAAADGRRVIVAGCAAALRPEQFEGAGVTVKARPDWTTLAAELEILELAGGADRVVGSAAASGNATASPTAPTAAQWQVREYPPVRPASSVGPTPRSGPRRVRAPDLCSRCRTVARAHVRTASCASCAGVPRASRSRMH